MVLHIRHSTPFSSYVKWVMKTQEITKSKFGEKLRQVFAGLLRDGPGRGLKLHGFRWVLPNRQLSVAGQQHI